MSAPAPIKTNSVQPPVQVPPKSKEPAPLPNGFISKNANSASNDVTLADGRKVTITVFFPSNTSQADKLKRLNQFNETHLKALGEQAVNLGLGQTSKKENRGKITSIVFKEDDKGEVETVKHFADGKFVTMNAQYFLNKLKKCDSEDNKIKKTKYERRQNAFFAAQTSWKNILAEKPSKEKTGAKSPEKKKETPKEDMVKKDAKKAEGDEKVKDVGDTKDAKETKTEKAEKPTESDEKKKSQ